MKARLILAITQPVLDDGRDQVAPFFYFDNYKEETPGVTVITQALWEVTLDRGDVVLMEVVTVLGEDQVFDEKLAVPLDINVDEWAEETLKGRVR